MTYAEKRERARELRKSGQSYSEIQKEVHVAKGTLSLWLRDIKLSDFHKEAIASRQYKGQTNEKFYREKRRAFQDTGREMARSISSRDF